MKDYDIQSINDNIIVFSTSYENPLNRLAEIENDLAEKKHVGSVLFDLATCNGMNAINRYISCYFNGRNFYKESFTVHSPLQQITEACKRFYQENKQYVDNGIIQPDQY